MQWRIKWILLCDSMYIESENHKEKRMYTQRTNNMVMCGILTALAMIFSYVESIIPIPIPIPGVKLGVANIAIVAVLYAIGSAQAVVVNVLRIFLTAMLFGNLNSFLFSMAGGMLSIFGMILLKKMKGFSMIGVSVAGGVLHNIGQILAAVWIMGSSAIAYYLPVLLIAGVLTGIVIGIVAGLVLQRIRGRQR